MKLDRPPQIKNVLDEIKKSIRYGNYRFSKHAMERGIERSISFKDAVHILENGSHNEKKTSFDDRRRAWKYVIEGKTDENVAGRVIVAFERGMVIITIIRLAKKKRRKKS